MIKTFRRIFVLLVFFTVFLELSAQQLVQGTVVDLNSSETLPGANVYWQSEPNKGVVSDQNGEFQIPVIQLPDFLVVSFLGYEKSVRLIQEKDLIKPTRFFLLPEDFNLEEVTISERRSDEQIKSLEMGTNRVSLETIKTIPALFGEVDLLRSLQLLPGVQTAGEGTTGLFVRGGSADQNLVQLDGAPVYNPSHFFGFFSVFNPDALDQVELYKGNMPVSFGGRLSSLIDVSLREGNRDRIKGEGGIGTISSRLTIDGPLFSDKSSFVLSGRRTYADLFLRLSSNEDIRNNQLNFHDLSGKSTFYLSEKDKLSVSSYQGRDFLGLDRQFGLGWSNWVSSVNWSRNKSESFFFDLQAYHSNYSYQVEFQDPENGFEWNNYLTETGTKAKWTTLMKNGAEVYWGIHGQLYRFLPIELIPATDSAIQPISTNPKNGLLNNLFAGAKMDLHPRLGMEAGLRWGLYQQMGPGVDYIYENDEPNSDSAVLDSIQYRGLESIKFYQGLEPRLAFRWLLSNRLSIKSAFNRNFQYVQVASNSSAGLPIDRWILAGKYVRPLRSDQISLGVYQNFDGDRWELSVEGYYKDLRNVIDLRNGAQVLFTDQVETEVLTGNGWAYGLEFLARKTIGKTTGWLAYTWSRAWRKVEGISQNQAFNPRFDRPHDLTLVLNHEFSPYWSAGLTFSYTTGQAVTFPIGTYQVDNQSLPIFSDLRNDNRYPNYHRMDASLVWKNPNKGRKWRGSWNFSIYNLYGRKNPFAYEFRQIYNDDITFQPSEGPVTSSRPGIVKTYLFTFLPSITYNFQF
ncbi:TonB-dependent receptor [Algoriphagus sp.]|uniref:TonB-dependent receptor n=1 Tax=Algoriphagus sp. TaxID=1872435 RepID=UPI00261BC3BE|nr:TonB-dependent receptor [Algoriphagus sp.]